MKKTILFIISFVMISSIAKAQFGNSIYLNGTNDYFVIQDNSYLDLTNNFTIDVWIFPIKVVDVINIINKGMCTGDNYAYNLAIIDGKINWMWYSSGSCTSNNSRLESVNAVIHDNHCSHIVLVHTDTEAKIYLNGHEVVCQYISGGTNFNIHNSSAYARIGVYKTISGSYDNHYWGTIDELRIWNYPFADNEVYSYIQEPLIGTETGLIAYYDMEDTASSPIVLTNKAIISGSALDAYDMNNASFMNSCINSLGINEISKTEEISIYPNPFNDFIKIEYESEYSYEIINVLGKVIDKSNKNKSGIIYLSDLKKGIYFIKLNTKEKIYTKEIIKM